LVGIRKKETSEALAGTTSRKKQQGWFRRGRGRGPAGAKKLGSWGKDNHQRVLPVWVNKTHGSLGKRMVRASLNNSPLFPVTNREERARPGAANREVARGKQTIKLNPPVREKGINNEGDIKGAGGKTTESSNHNLVTPGEKGFLIDLLIGGGEGKKKAPMPEEKGPRLG